MLFAVQRETTALDETLATYVALVRSLTGVGPSMGSQVSLLVEWLSTFLARKWSLSGVCSLVNLQQENSGKGTIADCAHVGFFLGVNATMYLQAFCSKRRRVSETALY